MDDDLTLAAIESIVGEPILTAAGVRGGFTTARCWLVKSARGTRFFVKVAVDDESASALINESSVLSSASGPPFPHLVAASEKPRAVAVEDLSDAEWSPTAFDADFWKSVAMIGASTAPDGLFQAHQGAGREWWSTVQHDRRFPDAIGLDPIWWRSAVPSFIAASKEADTSGSSLVHGDLAPGNWCRLHDGGWRFVDWGSAHVGNPLVDDAIASVRATRASTHLTWSPRLDQSSEFVAFVGGRFAAECLDVDWSNAPTGARQDRIDDIHASCTLTANLLGIDVPGREQP